MAQARRPTQQEQQALAELKEAILQGKGKRAQQGLREGPYLLPPQRKRRRPAPREPDPQGELWNPEGKQSAGKAGQHDGHR